MFILFLILFIIYCIAFCILFYKYLEIEKDVEVLYETTTSLSELIHNLYKEVSK